MFLGKQGLAAQLQHNIDKWQHITNNSYVIKWLAEGVHLPFDLEPLPFHLNNSTFTKEQEQFIDTEVQKLVRSGALQHTLIKPTCISPIGCVPKKQGKFRLIINLRKLNESCFPPSFQNEDIKVVLDLVKPNDNLITLDFKDGFHHIPVLKDHHRFLGVEWKGQWYMWTVLPFGLNASPYFFEKTLRPVICYLRSLGLRIVCYVDDFLLMAQDNCIEDHKSCLLKCLADLGWTVNFEKSRLTPDTCQEFIGYRITTVNDDGHVWISIPRNRIQKVCHDIRRALNKQIVTARALARITGQLVAMSKAILPAKLLLRNLYRLLRTRDSWQSYLILDKGSIKDLLWWATALKTWNGRAVQPQVIEGQITTDASGLGWGAHFEHHVAQGVWNTRMSQMPSNYREMMAVLLALHSFAPLIKGKVIQILSDNISCVAYVNYQGGPSLMLSQLATAIWSLCVDLQVTISAKFLAGKLNTEADKLSRIFSAYEWKLHERIFAYLNTTWGPHTMDRFASMQTTHLHVYNSWHWDPGTSGVDALAQQDWAVHNNFVNAPFRLIGKILNVILCQRAEATIIVPYWPAQRWFRRLERMLISQPIRLPNDPRLFWSMGISPEPSKNRRWKIYACRVSGKIG